MIANLFIVGPAGSGKTTLSGAFREWMRDKEFEAIIVNLDPGVDSLPYTPDVDIREWISLDSIMAEYNLGPNGAQVLAVDFIVNNLDNISKELYSYDSDYAIFDTPGQLELFAFRSSSEYVYNALSENRGLLAFMIDPILASTPSGLISQLLLANTIFFRFQSPYLNVLTKSDIISNENLEKITKWSQNSELLYEALYNEKMKMNSMLNLEIFKALENLKVFKSITVTSSKDSTGFEEIYNQIQQVYYSGEDLEKR
jgi:hypothetical protein